MKDFTLSTDVQPKTIGIHKSLHEICYIYIAKTIAILFIHG